MKIYVDIDNTICKTEGNDYEHAIPIPENIHKVNRLFDDGNEVYYWTARGHTSGKNWQNLTAKQLKEWGCKYNSIRFDKPSFDILFDDKASIL